MALDAVTIAQFFICVFFAILFLQSGFDKVFDFKGNKDYISSHFSKSPLSGMSTGLLGIMTILEVVTGFAAVVGVWAVAMKGPHWIPVAAVSLACVSFLSLFFGQRIAKDYAGAATLAIYFGVAIVSLFVMSIGFEVGLPT